VSTIRLSTRARVALALLPLCTSLACHRPPKGDSPRPMTPDGVIRNGDNSSIENMMAGRFPGVTVTPAPNGGLQIRIRGGSNSFYGSEEPLYVLDETPLPSGTGGIVFVNPYDIQRIEVLKNPADIAIYGIRGSNGVVKITTKHNRQP
jgi:TonB-dependent SusC/RagA subfamily outer membrane receptor